MKEVQTLARLERQMNDARQLRSETLASGWAGARDALSSVVRDTMLRLRGTQDPVQPYLQRWAAGFDRLPRI